MVVALHRASSLGAAGGQLVSSLGTRIVGGYIVFLPLGHKGLHAGHKDKNLLGVDGGKPLHSHQPEGTVVPDCVSAFIRVRGV